MTLKKCPKCGKTAKGKRDIQKKFGYRGEIPQSYCRPCRTTHGSKMDKIKANIKNPIDMRTKAAHKNKRRRK